jgi:hypothetical protein
MGKHVPYMHGLDTHGLNLVVVVDGVVRVVRTVTGSAMMSHLKPV